MMKLSDIHSHFIYGMDDGAQTRQEMEEMLDSAWADGVSALVATPHMTPGVYSFPEERFVRHFEQATAYCQSRGYAMKLYPGAEVLYTPALEQYLFNHRLPTLAGCSSYVLLEFAPAIHFAEISAAVELLERNGYIPILAHVERYKALVGSNIYRLKEGHSVLYQVNCNTVIQGDGFFRKIQVNKWFRDGLIDYVASDSHNCHSRKTRMTEAYSVLGNRYGDEYASRLVGRI